MLSVITQIIFAFRLKAHCKDLTESMHSHQIHQTLNHSTANVWDAKLQTFYKLIPKPKTILELKGVLQQIWDDLLQTSAISPQTHALWPVVNILNIRYELFSRDILLNKIMFIQTRSLSKAFDGPSPKTTL